MANTSDGTFVWHEHLTKDVAAAIAFYGEVIGWKTQPFGDEYIMWVGSQGPLGGVMKLPAEAEKMGATPFWMGHVQVKDVDATVVLAKELGGKVYKEAADIPTVGRFAILADPQGATISIFKPESAMTLHDSERGGEMCWSELMTTDSVAALQFYSRVFGWKQVQEMNMGAMGTYRLFGLTDKHMGGMMNTPNPGMPPTWLYYVEIQDLDAALARANRLGAKVMNGPMEVPGGSRIAQLTDPQGAAFALHETAKK